MSPEGLFFIDGIDIWTVYKMFVEDGQDDFLKFAAKKESITHDWKDSHGIDVDLSRVFLTDKEVNLRIAMIVTGKADFWLKIKAFIAQMIQPEARRVEPKSLGDEQFYCYYKECKSFTRFTPIEDTNLIAVRFTLTLVDTNQNVDTSVVHIVDEDGRFLVT